MSTCLLYLVAAGLFSKGIWHLEANQWNQVVGGDAAELGSGPGSYDIRRSVWHVNVSLSGSSSLAIVDTSASAATLTSTEAASGVFSTPFSAGRTQRPLAPSSRTTFTGSPCHLASSIWVSRRRATWAPRRWTSLKTGPTTTNLCSPTPRGRLAERPRPSSSYRVEPDISLSKGGLNSGTSNWPRSTPPR